MKAKKTLYLICSTVLGIILSFIAHAAIEIVHLRTADNITWYKHFGIASCALYPAIAYGLLIIGIIGGFLLGLFWWRIVYIEKRHWRFRKKSDNQQISSE